MKPAFRTPIVMINIDCEDLMMTIYNPIGRRINMNLSTVDRIQILLYTKFY
jgi:hypothetical protein